MAKSKVVKTKGTVENSASVIKAAGLPTLPQPLAKKVATAITAKADPLGMEAGLKAIAAAPAVVKENDVATAGAKPKGVVSAKEAVLAVFQKSPDREFKTDEVVAAVSKVLPKIQADTIRWMISEARKANTIHRVRNEGHQYILRAGPDPKAGVVVSTSPKAKTAPAASLVNPSGDLVAVLKHLTALVEQRAALDVEIDRLKKLI
jgi:hypothetical protein